MRSWTLRIALLAGIGALLPACGSGGGGGGGAPATQNGLLTGLYHAISLRNNAQIGAHADTSKTGTATFDGLGAFTAATTDNLMGTVSGPNADVWAYSVLLDGTFNATNGAGNGFRGGVRAAGDIGVLGTVTAGSRPESWMAVRKGGAVFSDAELTGDYFYVAFTTDTVNTVHRSDTGTVTFDGAGNYTASITSNAEGTIVAGTPAGTYSVAADGTLTAMIGNETFTGGVLAGGTVAIAASTSSTVGQPIPQVFVMIKKGGAFTDADLNGTYFLMAFEYDLAGPDHESETGTVTFDGAGNYTASVTENSGGGVGAGASAGTYSIAADGTATALVGGDTFTGGVLNGSGIAILGTTSGGADPGIIVLIQP